MNNIQKSTIKEIISLHNEISGYLKMSLEKAIRIGELLVEQKESLKHGKFTPWIKDNLPFTDRTARNYMRLYKEKDRLKTERVSDLTTAYGLLEAPIIHLKKEKIRRENENQKAELEYAKEHPEQVSVGQVIIGRGGAGNWKWKKTITGEMNGLPFVYFEVVDPEYKKLEEVEAPYDLSSPIGQAILNVEAATRNIKRVHKKFGDMIYDAYKLNFHEGIKEIYPPLMQAWKELKKLMDRIETNQANKEVNHERKAANSNL